MQGCKGHSCKRRSSARVQSSMRGKAQTLIFTGEDEEDPLSSALGLEASEGSTLTGGGGLLCVPTRTPSCNE